MAGLGENPHTTQDSTFAEAARPKILPRYTYYLDLRESFNPYDLPPLETITGALRLVFELDAGLMVFPLPRENRGMFQITLTRPITNLRELPIVFAKTNAQSGEQVQTSLFLKSAEESPIKDKGKEGLLVTIAQSAVGGAASIPNDVFNEALKQYGDIIVPTKLQNYRNSSVLNGNRYAVLTPRVPIPVTITVINPLTKKEAIFYTRYRGQPWYCRTCMATHTAQCDYLKNFYALKDQRDQMQTKTLIVSDSTLRRTQQVGLRADVECMPGGTIGQVAGALAHNPKTKDMSNIVIMAGLNDVKNNPNLEENDYLKKVEFGVEKLKKVTQDYKEAKFLVVKKLPRMGKSVELDFRTLALVQELDTLKERTNVEILDIPEEMVDVGLDDHPSEEGTQMILEQMSEKIEDLILDHRYITTKKIYSGVRPVYRYGCLRCFIRDGQFDGVGGYCDECLPHVQERNPSLKREQIKENLEEFNPTPGEMINEEGAREVADSVRNDLEMTSDESSEDGAPKSKLQRPNTWVKTKDKLQPKVKRNALQKGGH